jgi:hypothetical protein
MSAEEVMFDKIWSVISRGSESIGVLRGFIDRDIAPLCGAMILSSVRVLTQQGITMLMASGEVDTKDQAGRGIARYIYNNATRFWS